jgi:hypothetical protein
MTISSGPAAAVVTRDRVSRPGGGLARHVRRGPWRGPGGVAAAGRRDLVIAVTAVVGMAAVLSGPLLWPAAILVLLATIIGALQVLASVDGPAAEPGVPLETLFLPAVAAIGCFGAIRLVPLGLPIVPALLLTAVLIDRTLSVETRIAAAAEGPTDDDRWRTLAALLIVAFVAFAGVAAIVPGGIAGLQPAGAPTAALPLGDLVLLALADAVVAALLGYRAAALRGSSVGQALWAALTAGVAIAIGAAALRALGIARLIGPGLLVLLLYLWDALHAAGPARRRDPRWIWETVALAGLGAAVAFWNLRLVG